VLTFASPQKRMTSATNAYSTHRALFISPILLPAIMPSDPHAKPPVPGPISVVRGVTVVPSTENIGTVASFWPNDFAAEASAECWIDDDGPIERAEDAGRLAGEREKVRVRTSVRGVRVVRWKHAWDSSTGT
jgi:hypothetical protein